MAALSYLSRRRFFQVSGARSALAGFPTRTFADNVSASATNALPATISAEIGADALQGAEVAARPNDQGWNDGLLYYDRNYAENGNQRIYTTKRFYAMGNFSRYVRPGDRRYEVTGTPRHLRVLAFAHEPAVESPGTSAFQPPAQLPRAVPEVLTASRWTVVAINNAPAESEPASLALQFPMSTRLRLIPDNAVETSAERDLEPVDLPTVSATNLLSAVVPAQSITTYVLRTS
jgi:hypothetical protein